MNKLTTKRLNKKGFTLTELLIVIAIIGILIAILIPTVSNALNKAKQSTDDANIRGAYAVYSACYLLDDDTDLQAAGVDPDDYNDTTTGKIIAPSVLGDDEAKAICEAYIGGDGFKYYDGVEVNANYSWSGVKN